MPDNTLKTIDFRYNIGTKAAPVYLKPGMLALFVSRPMHGKTTALYRCAAHLAQQGAEVLFAAYASSQPPRHALDLWEPYRGKIMWLNNIRGGPNLFQFSLTALNYAGSDAHVLLVDDVFLWVKGHSNSPIAERLQLLRDLKEFAKDTGRAVIAATQLYRNAIAEQKAPGLNDRRNEKMFDVADLVVKVTKREGQQPGPDGLIETNSEVLKMVTTE